jgi:hypothetical protein
VLVFLGTKNSGSTKLGDPYIARFPDANGNVAQRSVPRPDVISKYFNDSNVIDTHNQARQGLLKLEKRWVTHNCWFRLDTTLIAMTITDCWRAYKHAMPLKKHKEMTIMEFADRLAHDSIFNSHSDCYGFNWYLATAEDEDDPQAIPVPPAVGGRQSDVSALTAPTVVDLSAHVFKDNPEREQGGIGRPIRRTCRADGCGKKYHKMCFNPSCVREPYSTAHGVRYGVFYCSEHMGMHYTNLQNGGI